MSTWPGWTSVKALLLEAGATVSPPITVVERGMPQSVPTDCIRFWYDGLGDDPLRTSYATIVSAHHHGRMFVSGGSARRSGDRKITSV